MHPKVSAGIYALWTSAIFTFVGLATTFITLAGATKITLDGVTGSGWDSPALFWAFTQHAWFPFALGNIVTPALRAIAAATQTKGPTT